MGAAINGADDSVAHLLSANDCFIVTQTIWKELKVLKQVLGKFCDVSGQSTNLSKFVVYFDRSVDDRIYGRVSRVLSIHKDTMSFKYLGFYFILFFWGQEG